jgi:hypothetical protein
MSFKSILSMALIAVLFSLDLTAPPLYADTAPESKAPVEAKTSLEVIMYKSPTCGCCAKWASHLRDNGFSVKEIAARSMAEIKRKTGVQPQHRSCHTAFIKASAATGDEKTYVIEGHVPATDIKRLLKETPDIKGLAVPGMPIGSPGMEAADGRKDKYEVLSFDDEGTSAVYARH